MTDLWQAPEHIVIDGMYNQLRQIFVQDCNSDGLADIYFSGSGPRYWINDGKGGWIDGKDESHSKLCGWCEKVQTESLIDLIIEVQEEFAS